MAAPKIDPEAAAQTIAALIRYYDDLGEQIHVQNPPRARKTELLAERAILRVWLTRYENEAGIASIRTLAS